MNTEEQLHKEIIHKLKIGLELFGTYAFDDKGANEVINLNEIIEDLKCIGVKSTINILHKLSEADDRRVFKLVSYLLEDMQDWDELWKTEDQILNLL